MRAVLRELDVCVKIYLTYLTIREVVRLANISREGHRQRLRETFLTSGADGMHDHNLLELLLTYAIPRKDVKDIAYALLNEFGSLENVFRADIASLQKVNGMGEYSAILFKLVGALEKRIRLNHAQSVKTLSDPETVKTYYSDLFAQEQVEKIYITTLDNTCRILGSYVCGEGTVNTSNIDLRRVVEYVVHDSATALIVAHNHPRGSCRPSQGDLHFTMQLRDYLAQLGVYLLDHVIVGQDDVLSMRNNVKYMIYFKA